MCIRDRVNWTEDLREVINYYVHTYGTPSPDLILMGFSAGAAVSVEVAVGDRRVKALALGCLLYTSRDTYVEIRGHGRDKINHAHAFGGIPLTLDTVEKFLGLEMNYYARINLQGFEAIVCLLYTSRCV